MGKWVKNWFSNFEKLESPFVYQGIDFWTIENFYQAMKVDKSDIETRKKIASVSASESKKLGKKVKLRNDWEQIKFEVMEYGLRKKFVPGSKWHEKLMQTGSEEIVEWNNWGDRIWGKTMDGIGQNHLGKILMKIRDEYKANA